MRNKKVYYESNYKLTKGETESDLTKYLGGKKAHEDLINNIKDVIESYKLMFILTAFSVVAAIVLAYILASLIKAMKTNEVKEFIDDAKIINDNIGGSRNSSLINQENEQKLQDIDENLDIENSVINGC